MNIEEALRMKPPGQAKPKNLLAGSIDIAIRDAEIHGTELIVKRNGSIERFSAEEMKRYLKKA